MKCVECGTEGIEAPLSIYVPDPVEWGRPATLHNIGSFTCDCGMSPVFPAISLLAYLMKHQPGPDYYWHQETGQWSTMPVEPATLSVN